MKHKKIYPVNYIRGKIANLLLTEAEYNAINTQHTADWIKGCLVKSNLLHLQEINCSDLLKLAYRYGGANCENYLMLRNAHLKEIGQEQYMASK